MDRALNAKSREPEGPQDLTGGLCHTSVSAVKREPSTAGRGEVLVVGRPGPAASPLPAGGREGLDELAARHRHSGPDVRAIEVRPAGRRVDAAGEQVRVLERIDVDRLAVGVQPTSASGRSRPRSGS